MFTWIQRYFQRHFGLICTLILVAMGIPMVVIFTPSSGIGQGDKKILTRTIFGYNLGSPEDQIRLFGDANLSATLQVGYAALGDEQLQQYALQRAAALHMADELHIPASSKAEIADFIKGMRAFSTEAGTFDANRYNGFRDSLKAGGRYTEADVGRVIASDVRADKVRKILAGPGYVLDADVVDQLKRIETIWTLGLATINYDNFKPTIKPTNAQLAEYYSDNGFRYVIGPRASVTYVTYAAADYMSEVSVNEDEMKSLFEEAPSRFQKPAADGTDTTTSAGPDDYALVRDQVEIVLRLAKARKLAIKACSDLSLAIYDSNLSNTPLTLASFLSAHQLRDKLLDPFTESEGPAEFDNSAEIAAAAFKLNSERFYSDAIPVTDGAILLLWRDTLPSRQPLLTEVLDKVTTDYLENEKRKLFVELGRKVKSMLQARLATGASLTSAATEVSQSISTKIEAITIPPFSALNPPQDSEFTNFNVLEGLEKGAVSEMIITKDKGLLVYASEKQLPDLTKANPRYDVVRKQIAMVTARIGASKALEEIVAQELKKSDPQLN